jgi:magnesium-protoporphyrin O-methyltransferase
MTVAIKSKKFVKYEQSAKKFFAKEAKTSAKNYIEKGLPSSAKTVVELANKNSALKNGVYLDVGCGCGQLCFELIKKGVNKTIGIDLSEDAIEQAKKLAENLGLANKAIFFAKNFVELETLPDAITSIILHRVLCCYPDLKQLLAKLFEYGPEDIILTIPLGTTVARILLVPVSWLIGIGTGGFHPYVHNHKFIRKQFLEHRYELVHRSRNNLWSTFYFKKKL